MSTYIKRLLFIAAGAFLLAGCEGSDGAPGASGADGQNAVDTGTISVTVTASGGPVAGATVTTEPATVSVDTDAAGVAVLADIPIGVFDVTVVIAGTSISATEDLVNVAAGLTTDVSFTLSGVPGTVTGLVLAPDGTPVEGATVSVEGSADVTTDAAGAFAIDSVVSGFVEVTPPAGSTLLAGGTRHSVRPGDIANITLSGGPEADATFIGTDQCLICHEGGLADAWRSSGHYRVVERSLVEMDLNGWPADPGPNACSDWLDIGVVANIPPEPPTRGEESHATYIRTCNDDPDPRYEVLFDRDPDDGAVSAAVDLVVPVYATYGGPGTQAGEIAVLQARDPAEATDIHGAWKQRYMFSIADLDVCSTTNPEGTFDKNPKPGFVTWDTSRTCEDMLILPIQFNQRSLEWVSYHPWEWYAQARAYSKKCSGCHEAGITLTAVDGFVTDYAAVDYRIGCEKCHGPGSSHRDNIGNPDFANYIMNPNHMTAEAATDICGACHNRGKDPIEGDFGFPWRSDAADFDGNFVAGLHTLAWDAVEAPEGYFLEVPKNWDSGYPKSHRQQINSYRNSAHFENPYVKVTCSDCHSPHSGRGGPYHYESVAMNGDVYDFGGNGRALMSNSRCLSCHATHGPFATVTLDDVAVYHTSRGGTVAVNDVDLLPTGTEQDAANDIIEQAVKAHSGERAGMPLAPYTPEESHIPQNYVFGDGPVGRCTSCHMTKTAKSGTWFRDIEGRVIQGDNTDHSFEVVEIEPGTDQPNACGSCHASFRTDALPPGGD